jgi:hypothetical protein
MARKTRERDERSQRASERRQRERDAERVRLAEQEARHEAIAPAAQRKPVLDTAGNVVRRAMIEPDGLAFKRSSPLCHLAARQSAITRAHLEAAVQLMRAWEDGGRGVGMGSSNYAERTSGTPQSGYIADSVLASLGQQNRAKAEFLAAHARLGALWPVIQGIVLDGMDLTTWAAQAPQGFNRLNALGYLIAALDVLVAFYAEQRPAKQRGIQAVAVVRTRTEVAQSSAVTP